MDVDNDEDSARLDPAYGPPAFLTIDNAVKDEVVKRVIPDLGGFEKRDPVLRKVGPGLLLVPLEDHIAYIQKCMYGILGVATPACARLHQ